MVQEIVLQLWRAFDRYNAEYKYSTWVYRIALNVAISFYRKESSRKKISHDLTDAVFDLAEAEDLVRKKPICNRCSSLLATERTRQSPYAALSRGAQLQKEIAGIIGIT